MIQQYPHHLFVRHAPTARQSSTGEWLACRCNTCEVCRGAMQYLSPCREETAGQGEELQTAGGQYIKLSATIYAPRLARSEALREGAELFIADTRQGEGLRLAGTLLKVAHEQLHTRLWI